MCPHGHDTQKNDSECELDEAEKHQWAAAKLAATHGLDKEVSLLLCDHSSLCQRRGSVDVAINEARRALELADRLHSDTQMALATFQQAGVRAARLMIVDGMGHELPPHEALDTALRYMGGDRE